MIVMKAAVTYRCGGLIALPARVRTGDASGTCLGDTIVVFERVDTVSFDGSPGKETSVGNEYISVALLEMTDDGISISPGVIVVSSVLCEYKVGDVN